MSNFTDKYFDPSAEFYTGPLTGDFLDTAPQPLYSQTDEDREEEERGFVRMIGDMGVSVMQGTVGIGEGLSWLAEKSEISGLSGVGEWTGEMLGRSQEALGELQSEEAQEAKMEGPLGSVEGFFHAVAESAPSFIASAGIGGVAAKTIQSAVRYGPNMFKSTAEIAKLAKTSQRAAQIQKHIDKAGAITGGMLGYGASEGLIAAGSAGAAMEDMVLGMDHDDLIASSDRYNQIYGAASDMEEADRIAYAKQLLADEAGAEVARKVGVSTFLLGAPAGGALALLTKGVAGRIAQQSVARATAVGAAAEFSQEFAQSGAEQFLMNTGIQKYIDPTQDEMEGVWEAAIGGGLVGGVLGGAFGAAQYTPGKTESEGNAQISAQEAEAFERSIQQVQAAGSNPDDVKQIMRWRLTQDISLPEFTRAMSDLAETGAVPENVEEAMEGDFREGHLTEKAFVNDGWLANDVSVAKVQTENPKQTMDALLYDAGITAYQLENGDVVVPARNEEALSQIEEAGFKMQVVSATRAVSGVQEGGRRTIIDSTAPDTIAQEAIARTERAQAAESPESAYPEATEAQKSAGNYPKAKLRIAGFNVSVETPKGAIRKGKGWSRKMKHSYGQFTGVQRGADGDLPDVFLGPKAHRKDTPAFVVNQVKPDGTFDEHKVVLGYDTYGEAKNAYLSEYPAGWQGLSSMVEMSNEQLGTWMREGDLTQPINPLSKTAVDIGVPRGTDGDLAPQFSMAGEEITLEGEQQQVITQDLEGGQTGTITQDSRGVVGEYPGYRVEAQAMEDGVQIKRADAETPGEGAGSRYFPKFVDSQLERGGAVYSDRALTEPAVRMYEKLAAQGYQIEQNPRTEVNDNGQMVVSEGSEQNWVFKVTAPAEGGVQPSMRAAEIATDPDIETEVDQKTEERQEKVRLTPGVAENKVRSHIREIVRTWAVNQPTLLPQSRLPQRLLDNVPEGYLVEGVYDPVSRRVYMVPENLESLADVERVLFEETLGHQGLALTFGEDLNPFLDRVYDSIKDKYGDELGRLAMDYKQNLGDQDQRRVIVNEWLSKNVTEDPSVWEIFKGWVRRWLRDHGFSNLAYSDAELKDFMYVVRDRVKNGIIPTRNDIQPGISSIDSDGNFVRYSSTRDNFVRAETFVRGNLLLPGAYTVKVRYDNEQGRAYNAEYRQLATEYGVTGREPVMVVSQMDLGAKEYLLADAIERGYRWISYPGAEGQEATVITGYDGETEKMQVEPVNRQQRQPDPEPDPQMDQSPEPLAAQFSFKLEPSNLEVEAEPQTWYYSQMHQILEKKLNIGKKGATPVQAREMVERLAYGKPKVNKKGEQIFTGAEFKAEEYEWSGLPEFFAELEGSPMTKDTKITKSDIFDVMNSNALQVVDVVLTPEPYADQEPTPRVKRAEQALEDFLSAQNISQYQSDESLAEDMRVMIYYRDQDRLNLERNQRQLQAGADARNVSDIGTNMFENHELGRLFINRMETEAGRQLEAILEEYKAAMDAVPGYPVAAREAPHESYMTKPQGDNYHEVLLVVPEMSKLEAGTGEFTGGHHSQYASNVVAHVLFNTRTTENGEKVLFLEEVQSDLHQKGRSGGYRAPPIQHRKIYLEALQNPDEWSVTTAQPFTSPERQNTFEVSIRYKNQHIYKFNSDAAGAGGFLNWVDQNGDRQAAWSQLFREYRAPEGQDVTDMRIAQAQTLGKMKELFRAYAQAELPNRPNEWKNMDETGMSRFGEVPNAPFKKTWPELSAKRMIRWAAENGFDRIAWSSGHQVAARYQQDQGGAAYAEYYPDRRMIVITNYEGDELETLEARIDELSGEHRYSDYLTEWDADELAREAESALENEVYRYSIGENDFGGEPYMIVDDNNEEVGSYDHFEDEIDAQEWLNEQVSEQREEMRDEWEQDYQDEFEEFEDYYDEHRIDADWRVIHRSEIEGDKWIVYTPDGDTVDNDYDEYGYWDSEGEAWDAAREHAADNWSYDDSISISMEGGGDQQYTPQGKALVKFYEEELPRAMKKYSKRYGSKSERVEIGTLGEDYGMDLSDLTAEQVSIHISRPWITSPTRFMVEYQAGPYRESIPFDTPQKAMAYLSQFHAPEAILDGQDLYETSLEEVDIDTFLERASQVNTQFDPGNYFVGDGRTTVRNDARVLLVEDSETTEGLWDGSVSGRLLNIVKQPLDTPDKQARFRRHFGNRKLYEWNRLPRDQRKIMNKKEFRALDADETLGDNPSVTITPELKESVKSGSPFPLFSLKKPGKPVMLQETVTIEETGETETIEVDSETALSWTDKRIDTLRMLQECIG